MILVSCFKWRIFITWSMHLVSWPNFNQIRSVNEWEIDEIGEMRNNMSELMSIRYGIKQSPERDLLFVDPKLKKKRHHNWFGVAKMSYQCVLYNRNTKWWIRLVNVCFICIQIHLCANVILKWTLKLQINTSVVIMNALYIKLILLHSRYQQ